MTRDGPMAVGRAPGRAEVAETAAMALALLVWALPLTHGAGGRDPWSLSLGLLSLLPALMVLRAWRHVPGWQSALAMSPAAATLVVCMTAPTHWDGLDEFATWAYAGGLFVATRAYARSQVRRHLVLAAVVLIGLEQFTQAYLPWWGGGDVTTKMLGTFYWHNQFGAFMLAVGVAALGLATRGAAATRLVGALVAPWCIAALFFASSRSSMGIFVLLAAIIFGLALRDRRGRVMLIAVVAAGVGLAALLASPSLMESGGQITATVEAREAEQSVKGNGQARLHLWRAALDVGLARPLTGAGFDTFGTAGAARLPADITPSIYVHNGFLQSFSDGGLVLLLAVTTAVGLPLLITWRGLSGRRRHEDDVTRVAAGLGATALVLHAGVDFDWAYPSLLGMLAIFLALSPWSPGTPRRSRATGLAAVLVLLLVVAALPSAARATVLRSPDVDVPAWARATTLGLPLAPRVDWLLDGSTCRSLLERGHEEALRTGLDCTRAAASLDPSLRLVRAGALVRLGERDRGVQQAQRTIRQHAEARPLLRLEYARVLVAAGRVADARSQVLTAREHLVRRGLPTEGVDALLESLR